MTNWTKVAQIGKNALRILLLEHNLSWPPWKMRNVQAEEEDHLQTQGHGGRPLLRLLERLL